MWAPLCSDQQGQLLLATGFSILTCAVSAANATSDETRFRSSRP